MLFEDFFIFSSAGHFDQQSETILAIFIKGHYKAEHFSEIIFKSDNYEAESF